MKILFICTGNTCRSPMAEGLLRDLAKKENLNLEVGSAGISTFDGGRAAENSISAMKDLNIDIENHRTRQVDIDLLKSQDLILTMSRSHRDIIIMEIPELYGKVFTLKEYALGQDEDIIDPFGASLEVYRNTRDEILQVLKALIIKLKGED